MRRQRLRVLRPARRARPVGIASIKWLGSIEVADHALSSLWNTTSHRMVGPTYPPDSPALPWGASLPLGRRTTLRGRAWSGSGPVRRVDVSIDGGATWRRARIAPDDAGRAWARWELPWTPRRPGATEVLARATDRAGQTQPAAVPFNQAGHQFWATVRHPVTVAQRHRASGPPAPALSRRRRRRAR